MSRESRPKSTSRLAERRYQDHMHSISFSNYEYNTEVYYEDQPVTLEPLIRSYKFLAVSETVKKSKKSKAIAKDGKPKCRVWLPHTIVYKDAEMPTWIFSDSRTGEICKTTNFSDRHVLQQLGDLVDEDRPVVVVKKASWKNKNGNESTLMSTRDLRAALQRSSSGGLTCIQQLVPCKGFKAGFTRAYWRMGQPGLAWQVTNRGFLDDEKLKPRQRLCTQTEDVDSCTIFPQRGSATGESVKVCEEIAMYLERTVQPPVRFSELAADFIRDPSGRTWLIQIKAFKLRTIYVGRSLKPQGAFDTESVIEDEGIKKANKKGSSYKKLVRCFSCLTECTLPDLPFSMSFQMTMETERHMRQRGKFLPWFGRPDFDRKLAQGELYEPHKVCQRCYLLYKAEQQLVDIEEQFAREIGVAVDATEVAATGSDAKHPEQDSDTRARALPPTRLNLYRFYVFLNDLLDLPEWETLELPKDSTLYCEFKLLGLTTRISIPVTASTSETKSAMAIRQMRTLHFFCQDEKELKGWLDAHPHLNIELYADPRRLLGTAQLPLRLFRGQSATKVWSSSSYMI